MCLTTWTSHINDSHLLRSFRILMCRMESKCHVVLFRVEILGCSSEPLNPQRNSMPPIWHNNCMLHTPPSHPASIETQKTEFILREEAGGYRRLRGRAATAASKITFLEMYAKSGLDLTRCILHQADLQV